MLRSANDYAPGDEVVALVDKHGAKNYGPKVKRRFTRDQAVQAIYAILSCHALRADSTAGVYAEQGLLDAFEIKAIIHDQEEADALMRFRAEKAEAAQALREKRERDAGNAA